MPIPEQAINENMSLESNSIFNVSIEFLVRRR